jgi:protein-L-isoaspartate O-methyltransferase
VISAREGTPVGAGYHRRMERKGVPALSALATERIAAEAGPGPGRLLELGCAGIHAPVLALLGWTVTVAERSAAALDRARERADGVAAVVSVRELDGEFDVVVGGDEAARYLRPGGRLIRP